MIAKALLDQNPNMKSKAASFASDFASALKEKCGPQMKKTIQSLAENLKHQHSKVRRNTLKGLKDVVVARSAEEYLEEAIPELKITANDRSQDVRMMVVTVVEFWLTNMDINPLKKFEKDLVMLLLNGVAEPLLEDISIKSADVLEAHGNNMKEALAVLEEDEEEKKENMEVDE